MEEFRIENRSRLLFLKANTQASSSGYLTFHTHNEYFMSKEANYLIPWNKVLPEKLTGPQLVKKFLAFYGTRRFVTAFTTVRHLSLSWAR
jgi:hypothetical protein